MKKVGIICEYNPLHNGHLHHLNEAKRLSDGGIVIGILTGYFSMRGDISVINKYDKVKSAINHGINITIELPYILGTQNADIFAYNSVNSLNKMGVELIVCGSEQNDLSIIKKAHTISQEKSFQNEIKELLSLGYSYRKSFSDALLKYNISLDSNDLLNLKYYEAIQKINPKIELQLIQRINNKYNDKTINDSNIQSATTIRSLNDISSYVPSDINNIFKTKGFYNINDFTTILKHSLLTTDLKNIFGATEGIENSFKTDFDTIDELVEKLTTKRYTSTRIKRFISYIITSTTKDIEIFNAPLRVTGFDSVGRKYLSGIKKEKNYFTKLINGIHPVYDKELQLAKIFSNIYGDNFVKLEQLLPYKKEA